MRITKQHELGLAEMLDRPARYTQRFVERLAFLPRGGQQWTRTLNVRIPASPTVTDRTWWVVPLGTFARRRLADISVLDDAGIRVTLVTRQEHGTVLGRLMLSDHLRTVDPLLLDKVAGRMQQVEPDAVRAFSSLTRELYRLMVSIGDVPNPRAEAFLIGRHLDHFLRTIGVPDDQRRRLVLAFGDALVRLLTITYYLCWIEAEPGAVVSVTATYTALDARQPFNDPGAYRQEPEDPSMPRRMSWYRRFGLAPFNVRFTGPSPDYAGSYYFTIEPPENTSIPCLACDHDDSVTIEDELVDCAHPSVHLHNDTATASPAQERGLGIHAYLWPDLREHKVIAAAAALNLAFVMLIGRGRLADTLDATSQTWVLLAPTILTGFLAQRQKHYYALATRWQRGVLWFYLLISVVFLVTVSFSLAQAEGSSGRWGTGVTVAAAALALSSAVVGACYARLGYWYQKTTRKYRKSLGADRRLSYNRAVLRYCNRTVAYVALALIATSLLFADVWKRGTTTSRLRLSDVRLSSQTSPTGDAEDARLSFVVQNHPALVTMTVARERGGVERGGACVPPQRLHRAPRGGPARRRGHRTHRGARRRPARVQRFQGRCDLLVTRVTRTLPEGPYPLTVPALPSGTYRFTLTAAPSHTRTQHVYELRVH